MSAAPATSVSATTVAVRPSSSCTGSPRRQLPRQHPAVVRAEPRVVRRRLHRFVVAQGRGSLSRTLVGRGLRPFRRRLAGVACWSRRPSTACSRSPSRAGSRVEQAGVVVDRGALHRPRALAVPVAGVEACTVSPPAAPRWAPLLPASPPTSAARTRGRRRCPRGSPRPPRRARRRPAAVVAPRPAASPHRRVGRPPHARPNLLPAALPQITKEGWTPTMTFKLTVEASSPRTWG